jgi:hypothetical protein
LQLASVGENINEAKMKQSIEMKIENEEKGM